MTVDRDFLDRAEGGDGLYAVAWALLRLTAAVRDLGTGNAATGMGGLELLAVHLGEKIDSAAAQIAAAIETADLPTSPTPHRKRAPAQKGPR